VPLPNRKVEHVGSFGHKSSGKIEEKAILARETTTEGYGVMLMGKVGAINFTREG